MVLQDEDSNILVLVKGADFVLKNIAKNSLDFQTIKSLQILNEKTS